MFDVVLVGFLIYLVLNLSDLLYWVKEYFTEE